jgi:hypothetical protein
MEAECKHCKQFFNIDDKPKGWMANHSRWCKLNPKRAEYEEFLKERRMSFLNEDSLKKRNSKIKEAWKNGSYENVDFGIGFRGKEHTDEAKSKISEAALNSNHRRLRKNPITYNGILLDSTWEYELAKRLDSLKIDWIRPEPLKWTDENGVQHNYFPDFYLPAHNLYLDPKNPHAYKVQESKINILNQLYNIKWILSLKDCINFNIA